MYTRSVPPTAARVPLQQIESRLCSKPVRVVVYLSGGMRVRTLLPRCASPVVEHPLTDIGRVLNIRGASSSIVL
jgi:hypothetical protein